MCFLFFLQINSSITLSRVKPALFQSFGTIMFVGQLVRFIKQPKSRHKTFSMYVSANHRYIWMLLNVFLGSIFYFVFWQCSAHALVRFRHKNTWLRLGNITFWIKIPELKMSWGLFINIWFCQHEHSWKLSWGLLKTFQRCHSAVTVFAATKVPNCVNKCERIRFTES